MTTYPTMDGRLRDRIESKQRRLSTFRPLDPVLLARLRAEFKLLSTFHSNAIEGNTLDLRETQLVIEQGITVGGKTMREHLEATNHAEAFDALMNMADRAEPITVETITNLHRIVLDKIHDEAGVFRTGHVHIRGSSMQPPHPRDVPTYIQQWLTWLNSDAATAIPAVSRAAIAHHDFEAIHPFIDGNGRVGRLLLNVLLIREGYPPALVLSEWRLSYIKSLEAADHGDYRGIVNLIGKAVERSLDLYLDLCETEPEAEYLPLSTLAAQTEYEAEYLSWLIRKGRLPATKRGGRWYSTLAAINRYRDEVARGVYPAGRPATK